MLNVPEQYIKMCKQAKEIQALWNPQDGDWFATNQDFLPNIYIISGHHNLVDDLGGTMWFFNGHLCNRDGGCLANETATDCMNKNGFKFDGLQTFIVSSYKEMIWLPRQNQLQDIIGKFNYTCVLLPELERLLLDYDHKFIDFNSFEELWLAFVMKEKFYKQWNGEDWAA